MKEKYIPADIEIIRFGAYDVITLSGPTPGDDNESSGGNGIGGGYNPGGWT